MHVGLNASLLSLGETYRSAGIHWYIYHLLQRLPDADPGLQYTAFLHERRFRPPAGLRVSPTTWPTDTPYRRIAWEQLVAPFVFRRERLDVVHAMAFVSPILSRLPAVVTVLDLSFAKFPHTFRAANRLYLQWMTRWAVHRARQVIAISEHTRQDVISQFGLPQDRVKTVYCGVDASLRPLPRARVDAFRQKKGLPERFILFLGTIQPRKNVVRLIDAFARLARDLPDVHLVIAGGKGWFFAPVFARVQELGLTSRVHFPGYVPEGEKRWWYNAATCFCFPSTYEGFGLPPLEAMACGRAVITSNASSLPEVVGGAGLTVPPGDTPALSDALHDVLENDALREELGEKAKLRARRFTWEKTARQTANIYRLVAGRRAN